MSGTIAVVAISYNRPRMLAECLASIGDCDQVIVADDGSDFDVQGLARGFNLPALTFVTNPPKPPARRMVEPSCGALLNRAIRAATTDHLLFVCDDDLLDTDWPRQAAAGLNYYPFHMVAGIWRTFQDGQDLADSRLCTFHFSPPLTTGNFAYRRDCATREGCWWGEQTLAVHDSKMLGDYIKAHEGTEWYGALDVPAGYRREHPKTISRNQVGADGYAARAVEMFAAGAME